MSEEAQNTTQRFSSLQRFAHWVLVIVVISLALTGLPQKYADKEWAKTIIDLFDGIESIRYVHHFAAILLILLVIYHLLDLGYWLFVRRGKASLLPSRKDFSDARDWLMFNLGLKSERPKMPFFNFSEKWDYWFTAVGVLILMFTGFLLWNPIAATKFLPGEAIPSARLIHGGQALLLLVGIGIWHLYNVLIKQFNQSMITGRLSQKQMAQEHGLARQEEAPASEVSGGRYQTYWLIGGAVSLLLLAGIYYFASFEETAVETLPHRQEIVFIPASEEGDAQLGAKLWDSTRCAECHGLEEEASGDRSVPILINTRLDFEAFFFQVRQGGKEMPAFSREEISDEDLLHLYTWITSEDVSQ